MLSTVTYPSTVVMSTWPPAPAGRTCRCPCRPWSRCRPPGSHVLRPHRCPPPRKPSRYCRRRRRDVVARRARHVPARVDVHHAADGRDVLVDHHVAGRPVAVNVTVPLVAVTPSARHRSTIVIVPPRDQRHHPVPSWSNWFTFTASVSVITIAALVVLSTSNV